MGFFENGPNIKGRRENEENPLRARGEWQMGLHDKNKNKSLKNPTKMH